MNLCFSLPLLLLTLSAAKAESEACLTSGFCEEGVAVRLLSGVCSEAFAICDDGDETTDSTCIRDQCMHTSKPDAAVQCYTDCVPSCEGKQCGEDDCGGFCGSCPSGQGCSNYACVEGSGSGSCQSPFNLGNSETETVIDTDSRITVITAGDTTQSLHVETPSCNTLTASPELIYKFSIPEGHTYGYDMRSTGYDTVLMLMKDECDSKAGPGEEPGPNIVSCNDDGTPPGDLGSKISGEITQGTYYVMVDGYSLVDAGPFELTATFIRDCVPLCDGNFCGDDGCGGTCGDCGAGNVCNANDSRCYPENCVPQCDTRTCGEDGCGGSCGECAGGLYCLGVSISSEDDSIPPSSCEVIAECDGFNPVCDGCSDGQICASDCKCYDSLDRLPDLVVLEAGMLEEMYLHDVVIPETSCSYVEGCVDAPGLRRLLRFTSTVLNQGQVDMFVPEPKENPQLFEFGACHQHYHFKNFAEYKLYASDGRTVVLSGQKKAYCMEDTVRYFDGANVACDKVYDCGFQGIQRGWVDSYGWSLDCSWLDVTDIEPGEYILEITTNPIRVIPEVSYDNNAKAVRVFVPTVTGPVLNPMRLETEAIKSPGDEDSSAAWMSMNFVVFVVAVGFLI